MEHIKNPAGREREKLGASFLDLLFYSRLGKEKKGGEKKLLEGQTWLVEKKCCLVPGEIKGHDRMI